MAGLSCGEGTVRSGHKYSLLNYKDQRRFVDDSQHGIKLHFAFLTARLHNDCIYIYLEKYCIYILLEILYLYT